MASDSASLSEKRSKKRLIGRMPKPAPHVELDEQWEAEMWRLMGTQFGVNPLPGCRLLRSGQHRIRLVSLEAYQLMRLIPKPEVAGLYLGELGPSGIRLSLDGSQLLGPHATKQVISLTSGQAEAWLKGETIDVEDRCRGYVIVRHQSDILGCGSLSGGRLHNFLPKDRRPQKQ